MHGPDAGKTQRNVDGHRALAVLFLFTVLAFALLRWSPFPFDTSYKVKA